jgi:hypothetical protein
MASNPKELEHARHWLLTVKKYLEHVFTKLGVENRHAAALRALEAAGLLGRPLSAESRQPFSARLARREPPPTGERLQRRPKLAFSSRPSAVQS